MEPSIIITNNIMILEQFKNKHEIVYMECGLMDVLKAVRDRIHGGARLLTHPLSGSIKPNETPYKTVLISKSNGKTIDIESLEIIENSIHTAEKLIAQRGTPKWTEKLLEDFRLIDFELIYHAIN